MTLDARLTGETLRFEPEIGRRAGVAANGLLTVTAHGAGARAAGRVVALATTAPSWRLLVWWVWTAAARVKSGTAALAWTARRGVGARRHGAERPVRARTACCWWPPRGFGRHREAHDAHGIRDGRPALVAYFVVRSLPLVGHVTAYSWDDWLAYQLAAARIYMHGFWLEAGNETFDYQALYRVESTARCHLVSETRASASHIWTRPVCLPIAAGVCAREAAGRLPRGAAGMHGHAGHVHARHSVVLRRPRPLRNCGGRLAFATAFLLMRAKLGRVRTAALAASSRSSRSTRA